MAAAGAARVVNPVLSTYVSSLDERSKQRYTDKISSIGCIDPYVIPPNQFSDDDDKLPPLEFGDLFTYLVITRSAYTNEQMKSYKGLEAYNHFTSGWVRERAAKEIKNKILVIAKVSNLPCIKFIPM
jgi:hypothetical protein